MNDHFPGVSQFCSPPRLQPLDSSSTITSIRNFRPKRETQAWYRKDSRTCTLRSRTPQQGCCGKRRLHWPALSSPDHREWRGTHAGWTANPSGGLVKLFHRQDRSHPCTDSHGLATRTQDGACRLEPEKQQCSDVGCNADTRDGLAGLWLCTDANEPQYTSVIYTGCQKKEEHPRISVTNPRKSSQNNATSMLSSFWNIRTRSSELSATDT